MSFTNQSDLMLEDNASKYPAIEVLAKLGYIYISPEEAAQERGTQYNVLLKDILRKQLQRINQFEYNGIAYKFSAENIERAIAELDVPLTAECGGLLIREGGCIHCKDCGWTRCE